MEDRQKEVYFHEYCKSCKYYDNKEDEEPCDECLDHGSNTNTHKPVMWEEK